MDAHGHNQGHSFLKPHHKESPAGGAAGASHGACRSFVPLSSLDEYDAYMLQGRRITYLKIDAELRGDSVLLDRLVYRLKVRCRLLRSCQTATCCLRV